MEDREYDETVDIWSLGCVFGELLQGEALLCGSTEVEQLSLILKLVGAPSPDVLKDRFKHLSYDKYESGQLKAFVNDYEKTGLEKLFYKYNATFATKSLMQSMLMFDPRNRIGAQEALSHAYFQSEAPPPARSDEM